MSSLSNALREIRILQAEKEHLKSVLERIVRDARTALASFETPDHKQNTFAPNCDIVIHKPKRTFSRDSRGRFKRYKVVAEFLYQGEKDFHPRARKVFVTEENSEKLYGIDMHSTAAIPYRNFRKDRIHSKIRWSEPK